MLVFLGVRFVFRMANIKGLMNWRRKAGVSALLVGLLLLVGSVWGMSEGQTRWPFRGELVRASLYHEDLDRWDVKRTLRDGPFHGKVHQVPFLKKPNETYLFAVADHKDDAAELLQQAGDDLRKQESSTSVRVYSNDSLRGWPPPARGRGPDELYLVMAALSCASGLLIAASGVSTAWIGIVVAAASSMALMYTEHPIPIGYQVQEVDYSKSSRPVERDTLPDHAFRNTPTHAKTRLNMPKHA